MRIAQIAPLAESVPPSKYGGTERVVWSLTEELVRRGHDVTLFASGDSRTSAKLVPVVPRSLRLDSAVVDPFAYLLLELGLVYERAADFDVIHSHVDYFGLPFGALASTPTVHTFHGRLDRLDIQAICDHYRLANFVSVSNSQRWPLPQVNWVATVYNGLDLDSFKFERRQGEYLAFLGRISPEKGVEQAIKVALRADLPLRIAAKIDPVDRKYYEECIEPLLVDKRIDFVGEVDEHEKAQFLARALALLFPICWPEPFGLVMVEAMACGTPVIAAPFGSVPEIIVDGTTGFICDSIEEMVLACGRIPEIDRAGCRRHVVQRFSQASMADGYEAVYAQVSGQSRSVLPDQLLQEPPAA